MILKVQMQKNLKRAVSIVLTLLMLFSGCFLCFAEGAYRTHKNWIESSFGELTEKYNNGEKFILYLYRPGTCYNSESIGNSVIENWMDDGEKIYGVDCDANRSRPSWFSSQLSGTISLPVIMFVSSNKTIQTFSGLEDCSSDKLQECYAAFTGREGKKNTLEPCSYTVTYHQTEARRILQDVNRLRTSGLAWYWNSTDTAKVSTGVLNAVTYDYRLEQVAMTRAAELAAVFAHVRPNGEKPSSLYAGISENIAYGYNTAEAVQIAWEEEKDSYDGQGHRRNMLNANHRAVGIACAEYAGIKFWVQEFCGTVGSSAYTTPCDTAKRVTVDIWDKNIRSIGYVTSAQSLSLQPKKTAELPQVRREVALQTTPGLVLKDTVAVQWSVDNTAVASIVNGRLAAHAVGTTYLRTTLNGQKLSIPVTVSRVLFGDANDDGAVNMKDVLLMRKYLAGMKVTLAKEAADVNGDGAVNMKDVLTMRKFLAGILSHL